MPIWAFFKTPERELTLWGTFQYGSAWRSSKAVAAFVIFFDLAVWSCGCAAAVQDASSASALWNGFGAEDAFHFTDLGDNLKTRCIGETSSWMSVIRPSRDEAERLLKLTVSKYEKSASKLATWMEDNLPDGFTVFAMPETHRRKVATTNLPESINKLIKKRTRVVGVFPSEASLLRLASCVLHACFRRACGDRRPMNNGKGIYDKDDQITQLMACLRRTLD